MLIGSLTTLVEPIREGKQRCATAEALSYQRDKDREGFHRRRFGIKRSYSLINLLRPLVSSYSCIFKADDCRYHIKWPEVREGITKSGSGRLHRGDQPHG